MDGGGCNRVGLGYSEGQIFKTDLKYLNTKKYKVFDSLRGDLFLALFFLFSFF